MNIPQFVQIGVGIDTARYGHHVSFMDESKRTAAKPFHFTESAEGYQQLQQALEKIAQKHQAVHFHIRLDAAGQYAENLLQWLHRLSFPCTISVGQPARNKAYRQVHYDKRKADPAESLACARFAIVERPPATPHNPPEFQQLRDAVALLEAASKQHTRLVNQLHGQLARIFPELAVHVKDIAAQWVLSLLDKYPTPDKLARARRASLLQIPHLNQEMAEILQAAAASSRGSSRGPLAEELVRQKVRALRQQQAEQAALQRLVKQAWEALPPGPHRRLLTIRGIGLQTAAALVAKIVSIDRFPTASALVGYFGIFPEEINVSGTDRHGNPKTATEIHMSRKGNDQVRRLLYTAAQCAVIHNPPVRTLFARLRADNKNYQVAIGHCMAKLLRQVFGLWKKDCDFDPQFETEQPTTDLPTTASATPADQPVNDQPPALDTVPNSSAIKKVVGHERAVKPQEKVVTTTTSNIPAAPQPRKSLPSHTLPPLNFAQLRQQIPIQQILEHLHWQPHTTHGCQQRGACPVHPDDAPASRCFAVQTDKNVYCCHRCGSEGNALDLWAAIHHQPILQAAWDLVTTFGLEPPLLQSDEPTKKDRLPRTDPPTKRPFQSGTRKRTRSNPATPS